MLDHSLALLLTLLRAASFILTSHTTACFSNIRYLAGFLSLGVATLLGIKFIVPFE